MPIHGHILACLLTNLYTNAQTTLVFAVTIAHKEGSILAIVRDINET